MKFWIVTPSFNQVDWLKLCIASVADQSSSDIEIHHHVQDGNSTDGTKEYLKEYSNQLQLGKPDTYTFSYDSKSDTGMYNAINRGWQLASDDTDFVAHINCDEQYLPNALKNIKEFFCLHKKTDVVLADMIVVDNDCEYICHRRSLKSSQFISKYICAGMTATTFHRLSVTRVKNVFFDNNWKNIGDKIWYNNLYKAGCRFSVYHEIVSIFTDTGENLGWTAMGVEERQRYDKELFLPQLSIFFSKLNGFRRCILELWSKPPLQFSVYSKRHHLRITKEITNPTWRWNHFFNTSQKNKKNGGDYV